MAETKEEMMPKTLTDPVTGEETVVNIYTDNKGVGIEAINPADPQGCRQADVYVETYDGKMRVIISPTPEVIGGEGEPTVIEIGGRVNDKDRTC